MFSFRCTHLLGACQVALCCTGTSMQQHHFRKHLFECGPFENRVNACAHVPQKHTYAHFHPHSCLFITLLLLHFFLFGVVHTSCMQLLLDKPHGCGTSRHRRYVYGMLVVA
uniref:Secreted protein n=1 Tax=Ixodes ricinus TaxID=34613 RepID=A0A6B0UJL0_IXORI